MTEVCAILAGGGSRRMGGGDKTLALLGGQSVMARIMARLGPQVGRIGINANGPSARFSAFDADVFADPADWAGLGPLSGIIAAMDWAAAQGANRVVTVAGDLPFLPADLVARFTATGAPCYAAYGAADGRAHPTCGLWPIELRGTLTALLTRGERRMMQFVARCGAQPVIWHGPQDPFMNLNTPEDFARAEGVLRDV